MNLFRVLLAVLIASLLGTYLRAQRPLGYDRVVVPQDRIGLRMLGYPPLDIIPDGDSAITALARAPGGRIYGATSGYKSYLFLLDPRHGFIQPLGYLPGVQAVTHALVVSRAGNVYIGASPNGHLYRYHPRHPYHHRIHIHRPCRVTDLGAAVPGQRIRTLVIARRTGKIYGLTAPDAHFFSYSPATHKFTVYGAVARRAPAGENFQTAKIFSRELVIGARGQVYASGAGGYIYRFNPRTRHLRRLPLRLPAIPGRHPWIRADVFLRPSGSRRIYGGTSDGYLFRFNPRRLRISDLGKPLLQSHVDGLAAGPHGRLYGVGGGKSAMARLFSYDRRRGSYRILGF
ncbi:MAG: hypothetical protein M1588_04150, partial [Planctomycetes bacterium]|nr:hypothetical protein [Planctomycetota bacterium]